MVDATCDLVEARVGKRPSTTEWIAAVAGQVDAGTLRVVTILMSIQSEELSGRAVVVETDQAVRYIGLASRTIRAIQQSLSPQVSQAEEPT